MADNPYKYGYYAGQQNHPQPPLPPFNQSSPSNSTRPPSFYETYQPSLNASANNYAAVNNSFQYNATSIPGLGMSNSIPPIPYSTTSNATWYPQPQTQAAINRPPIQAPEKPPSAASKQEMATNLPQSGGDQGLEEGELSEGEFDDIYEPKDTVDIPMRSGPLPKVTSATENQNGSVGDADGSSIYDGATPQGEATVNSTSTSIPAMEQDYSPPDEDWEPTYQEREKSGSYSPYLSPREIQRRVSVSKPTSHGTKEFPPTQYPAQSLPGLNMTPAQQPMKGMSSTNGTTHSGAAPNGTRVLSSRPTGDRSLQNSSLSTAEAKKKAQEAILGLWPLKVRYQDYILEGISEDIVKDLFAELGLETSIPKPAAASKAAAGPDAHVPAAPPVPSKTIPATVASTNQQYPTASKADQSTAKSTPTTNAVGDKKAAEKTAAEERKDKIARKLAAKAKKPVTAVQPSVSIPPSQPTPTNIPPAKTETRPDVNTILRQKLAALKAQQQKALNEKQAENQAKSASSSAVASSKPLATTEPQDSRELSASSSTVAVPALDSTRRSVSTEKSIPRENGFPGLSLASQTTQPTNRPLKRPVASDFDNYSTPTATLKRTRTQDTLIIDVSDDEDVEMDIGSPTDEPNSSAGIINPPPQKTPLAAFPPLSNSPNWKQHSSPNSTATPTTPVHGAKLDLLRKRIEETKRRIAEAEAKKKEEAAKKALVLQSSQPSATEPTSSRTSETPQARGTNNNAEELTRAMLELQEAEATLKEKQEMFKRAAAKVAELEQELQTSAVKRRRLSEEVKTLRSSIGPGPTPAQSSISTPTQDASPSMFDRTVESRPETPTQSSVNVPNEGADASTNTSESNHVAESSTSIEQEQSPAQVMDVTMAEGGDVTQDHEAFSHEVQPTPISSQPGSQARDQSPAVATTQSSQDVSITGMESQVEAIADQLLKSPSNEPVEVNGTDGNSADDGSEMQIDDDQPEVDIPEPSPHDSSQSNDDSYVPPPPVLPSSPHDSLPPALESDGTKALSFQQQINPTIDERPTEQAPTLTQIQPPQQLQENEVENPSGEVQNSSSYEHPILTSGQDESEQRSEVEDLTSYHSPLGYFRAFRFHPKYFDEVAGGLKSMTYSSRIDPMRELCPHALSGEQCPDGNNCEFQHFENMVLPDAEIITQLGSADMFTGETRNKFIEGLKKVLNELKANKVKDFDRITRAIVKHRQEFLEDKSKVLPLDAGTS
ncbi:hypothetical protein M426DRAFT_27480 [Hypoxylon sp. CI-4A]|nr:hypothetical protein M426DRAFT_27480 [Hypoxylon sp. CI-4A]